ncbi:MAG: hypothetical protein ABSF54_13560 [Bryobacteraceae bacterium]
MNAGRMPAGDVAVPHVLTHDGPVLALDQGIVGRMASPRFGEFRPQFFEELDHPMIDELRSVVEVQTQYGKGVLGQHRLEQGLQMLFTDAGNTAHHLPLRHGILAKPNLAYSVPFLAPPEALLFHLGRLLDPRALAYNQSNDRRGAARPHHPPAARQGQFQTTRA